MARAIVFVASGLGVGWHGSGTLGAGGGSTWVGLGTYLFQSVSRLVYGVVERRNLLFLRDSLPDPSIFTSYWSCSFTWMTVPVLSHLRGLLPHWFCTRTVSPAFSLGCSLVCLSRSAPLRACLLARAVSLWSLVILHSGRRDSFPGRIGMRP